MAGQYDNFVETTHPLNDKNGTRLPVGTRLYHFLPNAAGHYVAEVLDERDRAAILSISAGYRRYNPDAKDTAILRAADSGHEGIDTGSLSDAALARDREQAELAAAENVAAKVPKPSQAKKQGAKANTAPSAKAPPPKEQDAAAPPEEGGSPPAITPRPTRKPGTKTAQAAT